MERGGEKGFKLKAKFTKMTNIILGKRRIKKKKDVTRVGLEPTLSFPNQDAC